MKIAVIGENPEQQLNLWVEYIMKVDLLLQRNSIGMHPEKRKQLESVGGFNWSDPLQPQDCWIECQVNDFREGQYGYVFTLSRGLLKKIPKSHIIVWSKNILSEMKFFDVRFEQ